jgi:hypothetical protein
VSLSAGKNATVEIAKTLDMAATDVTVEGSESLAAEGNAKAELKGGQLTVKGVSMAEVKGANLKLNG